VQAPYENDEGDDDDDDKENDVEEAMEAAVLNSAGDVGPPLPSDTHQRRGLLMYYGARKHITVHLGSEMTWIKEWNMIIDPESEQCQSLVRDFEERVNQYGYSLVDLAALNPVKLFPRAVHL
jgi:hypothetical protein